MEKTAAMTMKHAVMARPVSGAGNILTRTAAINSILYNSFSIIMGSILCAWTINTIGDEKQIPIFRLMPSTEKRDKTIP